MGPAVDGEIIIRIFLFALIGWTDKCGADVLLMRSFSCSRGLGHGVIRALCLRRNLVVCRWLRLKEVRDEEKWVSRDYRAISATLSVRLYMRFYVTSRRALV